MTQIKVTDRRMFTPDGELREEFRDVEAQVGDSATKAVAEPAATASTETQDARPVEASVPPAEPAPPQAPQDPAAAKAEQDYAAAGGGRKPGFFEMLGLLAEPASVYLQQAQQGVQRAQHLEAARLHIDLLGVLREKSEGNLSFDERTALEDALYQLRLAYLEVKG